MCSIADLFTRYNCTNCQDDINGIRVHCAECENFDLCLQCFAAGAEIGSHQNNHPYQFMDTGTAILSVFRGKGAWTAREEIRLLDAIEQYGFGNWEDISKHIETKSAEDAKEEYVNKFVNGTIGRHTWKPAQSQRPTLVDHTTEDTGPLGESALQKLPPLDITPEEAAQLGYMPNRDSFEREYDPTAEQLISSISLNADDTETDYMLKLAHVDMYTRRLRERVRRKRIVRDYQLVANFFRNKNYAQHPELTREQKEFRDRFRVFSQFYTANEYERLLASLEREKELRVRLAELYRYRENGLTKIDECRHFEQHAAIAQNYSTGTYEQGKTDNTHPNTGSHRHQSYTLHSPAPNSKKAETLSVNEASSSSIAQKSTHLTEDPICSVALSHNKNSLDSCRGSSAPMTTTTTTTMTLGTGTMTTKMSSQPLQQQLMQPTSAGKNQHNDVPAESLGDEKQQIEENNTETTLIPEQLTESNANPQTTTPMSNILRSQLEELKHLPQPLGSNLLTSNEQHFCKVFNLPPTMYMSLKAVILSGAPVSPNPSPVESSVRKYFIKAGWLSH